MRLFTYFWCEWSWVIWNTGIKCNWLTIDVESHYICINCNFFFIALWYIGWTVFYLSLSCVYISYICISLHVLCVLLLHSEYPWIWYSGCCNWQSFRCLSAQLVMILKMTTEFLRKCIKQTITAYYHLMMCVNKGTSSCFEHEFKVHCVRNKLPTEIGQYYVTIWTMTKWEGFLGTRCILATALCYLYYLMVKHC